MATQFFSDEQMEWLRSYPDVGQEGLIRFFTLTRRDLGFVENLGRRAPAVAGRSAMHAAVAGVRPA